MAGGQFGPHGPTAVSHAVPVRKLDLEHAMIHRQASLKPIWAMEPLALELAVTFNNVLCDDAIFLFK